MPSAKLREVSAIRNYLRSVIVRRLVIVLLILVIVPAVVISAQGLEPKSSMPSVPIPGCHQDEGISRPCPSP